MRQRRPLLRLAACVSALAFAVGCARPPATTALRAPATAGLPLATATSSPPPAPVQTATPRPSPTPRPIPVPAGAVAVYGVAVPQERMDLCALAADGSVTALGVQAPWDTVASADGRWLAHLDAPLPDARAIVVRSLADGRQYTVPLSEACTDPMFVAGLLAFDREGRRLASVEFMPDGWALTVIDLQDGSSRRFDPMRVESGGRQLGPGYPMGWAATGELLISTFTPYSGGGHGGIYALRLPAGDGPIAARQLIAPAAYSTVALSPDGTQLLYTVRDPDYTPDGYTLNGGEEDVAVNQLWLLDVASGTATELVEVTDGSALDDAVSWSPDGREVLFVQTRYDGRSLPAWAMLKAVDTAGAVREIGPLAVQGYFSVHWCRPGLAVVTVYDEVSELYTLDLATAHMTFVARNAGRVLAVIAEQAGPAPAGTPAPVTSSPVDGWSGVVVRLDSTAQLDDYFQRADGEKFGIDGAAAGLSCPLESAGRQGATIRVWGRLLTSAADAYGRQIVVQRLEYVNGSTPPAGQIAFIAPDGRLRVVGTDGQRAPGPEVYERAASPAWSADGSMLAYVDVRGAESHGSASIYYVASGRDEPVWVPRQQQPSVAQVSWSLQGRYLVLESGTGAVSTLDIVEAPTMSFFTPLEGIEAVGYAWSPDGARLAIGLPHPVDPPLPGDIGDSLSLAVVVPGRRPEVVFEGSADVLYRPLAWLPDGRLLYQRTDWPDKSRPGRDSLWTARIDGTTVYVQPARDIPLAYDPQALLALLPAELRDTVAIGSLSWAPDGRWVAFQAGSDPHWGVYMLDTQGSAPPRCLADGASPAWRP